MQKLVICCLLVAVLVAVSEATSHLPVCEGRCTAVDLRNNERICARNPRDNMCTKLRPCRLRETNCKRKEQMRGPLIQVNHSRCSRIKAITGTAACTRRKVKCKSCPRPRTKNSCWKNRKGCRLWLNDCVAKRRNCRNKSKPRLQLTRTADWKCEESKKPKPVKE